MGQIKPISEKTDTTREEKEQAEALIHIIRDTFNAYMLNIDYNIFLSNFIRHIQALLIRARNKQFVINLITENIRETSPFVYDVAVHLAKSLEDFFHIQIIDEEIGLLSIYIGFIIEQSASHSEAVKVLIVCNDYKQIASHILKTLRERHGNTIEILDVIPLPPAAAKYKNAELIIHTLPMNLLGKPSVLISPFCSDLDQEKISQALTSILQHKKHLENQRLLKSYFSEALYFRNQGISCKNDAIRFLGEHVEESGLCSAGFTQSVLKRESMSSTCFMEAFAVPHALELNAQRTCFAVLIEEDGILWDDTRINCVLLIAVCREDRKEFMKIYSGIIQYLFQKEAVDKLTAAPDFHHFINCFNQTA